MVPNQVTNEKGSRGHNVFWLTKNFLKLRSYHNSKSMRIDTEKSNWKYTWWEHDATKRKENLQFQWRCISTQLHSHNSLYSMQLEEEKINTKKKRAWILRKCWHEMPTASMLRNHKQNRKSSISMELHSQPFSRWS